MSIVVRPAARLDPHEGVLEAGCSAESDYR